VDLGPLYDRRLFFCIICILPPSPRFRHHCQKTRFCGTAFVRRFCETASGFHFFGFRNANLFYRARPSDLRPTLNQEDQVPVFMSPSNRVAQLYLKAPGSLFVAFYDSQSYGGCILTRLHLETLVAFISHKPFSASSYNANLGHITSLLSRGVFKKL
jgi:hypothetical protein